MLKKKNILDRFLNLVFYEDYVQWIMIDSAFFE